MNLTRRDFLKGGAITAVALAVGMKLKERQLPHTIFGLPVREWKDPPAYHEGDIVLGDLSSYIAPEKRNVILNVSPELVQADVDWDEWRQELHHALAVGLTERGFSREDVAV